MTESSCLSCGASAVRTLLDFGPQPPSNRFVPVGMSVKESHPLVLGQCDECGLVQLIDPMPVPMVLPRHLWLSYNEPEGHLDALVDHLARLVRKDAKIFGLTYKDDSTLARLNRCGYVQTYRYNMKSDFGVDNPCAGLETVQAMIDEELTDRLVEKHGKADLLIVRHVLEHAHAPIRFAQSLSRILAPDGILVFEMPDCRKFINACDYSFVWEEHISYFSPSTVANFVGCSGFGSVETQVYPYPLEDSLVAIVRSVAQANVSLGSITVTCDVAEELAAGEHFAGEFDLLRRRTRSYFESLKIAGKRSAVFGAGHLATKFINLFGIKDSLIYVIDDNVNKQGLAMPGSGLAIVDSSRLPEIDLCMLTLSPESEQKVLAKHKEYANAGGRINSIFVLSDLALKLV